MLAILGYLLKRVTTFLVGISLSIAGVIFYSSNTLEYTIAVYIIISLLEIMFLKPLLIKNFYIKRHLKKGSSFIKKDIELTKISNNNDHEGIAKLGNMSWNVKCSDVLHLDKKYIVGNCKRNILIIKEKSQDLS
ncbi:hypothetical protein COF65_32070 [Bacillus toyonensis]|uniref:hypothetical protein n=1 Tax=Bacillus cereus group TaxID=86661 RepID=UPI000BF27BEF|nr:MULTISPECIES: hypothetical protein [Bacillus cereus group]PEQ70049.1 hypothetical protein CN474_17930 [Bacillus thuringiensis]PHD31833.1 hypothetical protein COF65_32070 [Bacillus toyonensis]